MNLKEFKDDVKKMSAAVENILISKNKDYSYSEDVHSNFRAMAQFCKICKVDVTTPEGCMQYELLKKTYRMLKLINSKEDPEHESLWDNSMDNHAYQHLLNSYIHDQLSKGDGYLEVEDKNVSVSKKETTCQK